MSPRYLADGEVHVWTVHSTSRSVVERCRAVLSREEAERTGRFVFERDRTMSVVSRGFRVSASLEQPSALEPARQQRAASSEQRVCASSD